jgi:hypothetical protein
VSADPDQPDVASTLDDVEAMREGDPGMMIWMSVNCACTSAPRLKIITRCLKLSLALHVLPRHIVGDDRRGQEELIAQDVAR